MTKTDSETELRAMLEIAEEREKRWMRAVTPLVQRLISGGVYPDLVDDLYAMLLDYWARQAESMEAKADEGK